MCWRPETTGRQRRRLGLVGGTIACLLLATLVLLAQPSPPQARANVPCDVGTGPIGAVTGAIGLGNPAGDVCDKVSGAVEAATGGVTGAIAAPVDNALKGVGDDVFKQLTGWVAEGASWLMGQVVHAIDTSTTPQLDTEGFLSAYGRMAAIAAVMACAMLLLAILEGIAQGSPGLLARVVLVNLPLALLGTSLAFAVVQLLLGVTDGLSAAIAGASHHDSTRFFEAAIGDLGHLGGEVGKATGEAGGEKLNGGAAGQAAGAVAVPLFVGFLAAIVGAFAAFFVWVELLMRDAAVYAVSLFMPLALAASIWPRWTGALRRTGELLVAVIGSKFVIVAIVSLAASLIAEEASSVEHVLAASALMCLACFAPFVLLRLIPFSEGAFAAAYGRRSAAGGAVGAMQIGSDVQILRNMGRSGQGSGVSLWSSAEGAASGGGTSGGGGGGPGPGRPGGRMPGQGSGGAGPAAAGRGGGAAGGAGAAGGSGAGGAGGGPAAVAAVPAAAVHGAKGAAGRLSETATAQQAGAGNPGDREGSTPTTGSPPSPQRPRPEQPSETGAGEAGSSPPATGERPPRPSPGSPGAKGDGPGGRP